MNKKKEEINRLFTHSQSVSQQIKITQYNKSSILYSEKENSFFFSEFPLQKKNQINRP